jgi:fibronectin-binding autotransporter adhesin
MMKQCLKRVCVFGVILGLVAGVATAADLYSSGDKTWDTSTANWGAVSGATNGAIWNSGTPDNAIFEGTAGAVTLGEDIDIVHLRFTTAANNYTVGGNTLNFAVGGSITQGYKNAYHTITSAIIGSPDVGVINGTGYNGLTFAPTAGTVMLGTCTVPYDDAVGGDKAGIHFGGSTTGNSVSEVRYDGGDRYGGIYVEGSGSWTFGDIKIGTVYITGSLIANGTIDTDYGGLQLQNGGTLHYNNAGAVLDNFKIYGGSSLDNTSGSATSTSDHNPPQTWGGNWTFIGSNGTDSDLNLGAGTVTLSGNRTVTIQNAAATLTIGGTITDGTSSYGLTKAGAGTLKLTGVNTYNGATTVSAGTLSLGNGTDNSNLDDDAIVSVATGATLDLNFASTNADSVFQLQLGGSPAAVGTWGSTSSTADNKDDTYFSGTGVLNNLGGLAPAGTWYWDGSNYGGTGNGASDGGSGVWSTTSNNWDQGFVSRKVWPDTTNDMAIFRTSAGTVDLQSDITLGELLIDGADNYVIGSTPETNSLAFGGTNMITVDQVKAYFRAGIAGSPKLRVHCGSSDPVYLWPGVTNMTLGAVTIGGAPQNNPVIELGGTTSGNSISQIINANNWSFLDKKGSSTWTVGNMTVGTLRLSAGTFVLNGMFNKTYIGMQFTGGTLAGGGTINMPVTVPDVGTLAPGDPTGTLTITNSSCTIKGTLAITVDGSQSPAVSTLAVDPARTLTISNATLNVSVAGSPGGSLVIATYGTLAGEFAVTNGLEDGWSIDYAHDGGTGIALLSPPAGSVFIVR